MQHNNTPTLLCEPAGGMFISMKTGLKTGNLQTDIKCKEKSEKIRVPDGI